MKNISPELLALLTGQRKFFMADCYTITLAGGTVLRYTSADADLVVHDGRRFLGSRTPIFERGRTRTVRGMEVDTLTLDVFCSTEHTVSGVPWLQAIAAGAIDHASVDLERAFAAAPGSPVVGTLSRF